MFQNKVKQLFVRHFSVSEFQTDTNYIFIRKYGIHMI